MSTGKTFDEKPYAGNPHVRFDEGEVAPRRGSLLYHEKMMRRCARTFAASLTAAISFAAFGEVHWYVDCVNGDDTNPGTEAWPKQTIRAATTNAVNGDVIHVAPGTYGVLEGSQKATAGSKIGTRVVIPAGVTVESTAGAERTFIVGAAATGDQIDVPEYKTGTNAVRCVYALRDATLRGFTLTGGYGIGVGPAGVDYQGAAFYAESARNCYIEDCIVSNNIAAYGTIYAAVVRRCRVIDNWGVLHSSDMANSASAGHDCSWYSCIIDRNHGNATLYNPTAVENCTIGTGNKYVWSSSSSPQVFFWNNRTVDQSMVNSVVLGGRFYFTRKKGYEDKCLYTTNCIFRPATNTVLKVECAHNTRFSVPLSESTVDADYRPVLGSFIGIDTGDASANRGTCDKDALGNPRILNGAIDIGAVEYDWRPKFAQELGRSFTMTYASPTVTTNETGGVLIPADCGTLGNLALPRCIAGTPTATGAYEFRLRIEGGRAEVYVGGVLAEEVSGTGEHSVRLNVTDVTAEIRFVFTPDVADAGSAILHALTRANGFIFYVK